MDATIKYLANGMAVFEERNGDFGVISLRSGGPIEVHDEFIITKDKAINKRTRTEIKICIEDHGMYYDDAVALVDSFS